jgi:hypothetical protein
LRIDSHVPVAQEQQWALARDVYLRVWNRLGSENLLDQEPLGLFGYNRQHRTFGRCVSDQFFESRFEATDSSFSEEKEAKRLLFLVLFPWPCQLVRRSHLRKRVIFWSTGP